MSQRIVVKSFADLALVLNLEDLPAEPAREAPPTPASPAGNGADLSDLTHLLAELETASSTLAAMVQEDQAARASALRDLEQYDALVAAQREAEQARDRARQVRADAETLAESGFTQAARATAARVAQSARQLEGAAADLADQRRQAAERLAAHLDLEQLLTERRRQAEAERARQLEVERTRRLTEAVATAQGALDAGRWEEAMDVLARVAHEAGDCVEVKVLHQQLAQREFAVKVTQAEDALWAARREYRHDPATAVARLEALDVAGLPDVLSRQVFGAWARACARLCQTQAMVEPLRYAPNPGCGAIIARSQADGPYVVVSTLGLDTRWRVGSTVAERLVRGARPLR